MKTTDQLLPEYAEMDRWLRSHRRILIVTHKRPDGDAFGSSLALASALRDLKINCAAYFCEEPPDPYMPFMDDHTLWGDLDLSAFDYLVAVDCATAPRLGLPNDLVLSDMRMPCANIDHHVSNENYGEVNLVDAEAAATSEILTDLFNAYDYPVSKHAATQLLLGVTTDTGCFRFTNTDSAILRAGAWLMDQGGDYNRVMEEMYFNTPLSKMRLQAKVVESLSFAFNGRVAYFYVTDEMIESCGGTSEDAEDLVDVVRTIQGVEIVIRMQEVAGNIRFSFRSQNLNRPIIGIARELDGGGHPLAAGATMEKADLPTATQRVLELMKTLYND